MPAIAVVGNINADLKTSVLHASPALFADGETSVPEIYETIGGGGANIAVAAALLGARVHFCGCVGEDRLGNDLAQCLRRHGVTPHLCRRGSSTGRSINLTWDNRHRHFLSSLPNNLLLTAADVDIPALALAGCRHLFRADVWFSTELLDGGNSRLFAQARALGIETSIDVNWDPEWTRDPQSALAVSHREQLRRALPHVTWVHGNERELNLFTGIDHLSLTCRALIDQGASGVIIHRGERGAAAFLPVEGFIETPAVPVTSIVCETGSGDVFSAAFMLFAQLPMPDRLARCCETAAQHLQGTLTLIPLLHA